MTTKDLADAFVEFKQGKKGFVKTKKKYVNKFIMINNLGYKEEEI